ncbi:MAG TPA: MBL fold metallo-hydrolase [Flavobacteriales bacterium]|nr:MBL fold metallo-hydrolase [Flavobacteriales bacterium]
MELYPIDTGFFKLDGGAMFGVVPKPLWSKQHPPDEKNLCTWAMRCLLVRLPTGQAGNGDRLILIDNGIGNKQDAKFFGHYDLHGDDTLEGSLKKHGFSRADITDVFLTHLHFDHCGGSIVRQGDGFAPAFPNATYWSNRYHWDWATKPNAREKASFLKENILPIQESGQLKFVEFDRPDATANTFVKELFPGFDVLLVNGHTDAMMIPHIRHNGRTLVYMADLLPSIHHIPLPWVMAYDTRPLLTLNEKGAFLEKAAKEEYVLFLEHDPVNQCAVVEATEKGVRLKEVLPISAI